MDNKEKSKIDPVCGMVLDGSNTNEKFFIEISGKKYFFCGNGCFDRFKLTPNKFMGQPAIRLDNVWKIFDMGAVKTEVLKGISLNVWPGEFVAIIGSSGSGKSTSLNMIGLLDRPTSGKIFLHGQDVSLLDDNQRAELRTKSFGFVFQQFNLIPWLTAKENVTMPLIFSGGTVSDQEAEKRFASVDLKERMTHRPFELSGGEQQRTAFLRALINDPEIILGDEPTGNLDSQTGNKLLDLIIGLNKKEKKTLIIITHDADIARKADQVITLKDGRTVADHHVYQKQYTETSYA